VHSPCSIGLPQLASATCGHQQVMQANSATFDVCTSAVYIIDGTVSMQYAMRCGTNTSCRSPAALRRASLSARWPRPRPREDPISITFAFAALSHHRVDLGPRTNCPTDFFKICAPPLRGAATDRIRKSILPNNGLLMRLIDRLILEAYMHAHPIKPSHIQTRKAR
jgi:hypothetical protein